MDIPVTAQVDVVMLAKVVLAVRRVQDINEQFTAHTKPTLYLVSSPCQQPNSPYVIYSV